MLPEDKARSLALQRDLESGKWLLGRKGIHEQVPELSEWKVRQIIQDTRGVGIGGKAALTPEEQLVMDKTAEQMKMPTITLKIPKLNLKKPVSTGVEEWVIASDFHAPYHHQSSCDILYQVMNDINPSKVILLGDLINLDQFSRYNDGKHPGSPTWIDEVSYAGDILGKVRQAAPNAKLQWFEGNHEYRLKKYLMKNDPILYGHFDISTLFQLSKNDDAQKEFNLYEYIDLPEILDKELGVIFKHGNKVRSHAGMSAIAEMNELQLSVVMGHCHRLGITRKASGRARYMEEPTLFAMEVGCMCNYDLGYLEGVTVNWQHGFGVLTIIRSGDTPIVEPSVVAINNGKAFFRGKLYRS